MTRPVRKWRPVFGRIISVKALARGRARWPRVLEVGTDLTCWCDRRVFDGIRSAWSGPTPPSFDKALPAQVARSGSANHEVKRGARTLPIGQEIVVKHLGVEADKGTETASCIDDLGADSLDTSRS